MGHVGRLGAARDATHVSIPFLGVLFGIAHSHNVPIVAVIE